MKFFRAGLVALVGAASVAFGAPAQQAAPVADASNINIGDIINLLGIKLVDGIEVKITLDTLTNNLVSINFNITNPLPIELSIDGMSSVAGIGDKVYSSFDHKFAEPFYIPPFTKKNSGQIDNVLLTQGAIASLDIIPLGYLDLIDTNVTARAATIFGHLGIPVPLDDLTQKNVTTVYNLAV